MTDFNELIDRINDNITDVVEHYAVDIKRSGANYKACCPFHNEKTPSFMVSPAKGIYKCFGCGKGGDSVSFIQEQEGFQTRQGKDFIDILKVGAKIFNIDFQPKELTDEERQAQLKNESLKIAHAEVAKAYAANLNKHPQHKQYLQDRIVPNSAATALKIPTDKKYVGEIKYCTWAKRFTPNFDQKSFDLFLEQWQIGWADGHNLVAYAKKRGLKTDTLIDTGIVRHDKRSGNLYDFFADRITFPIFDLYSNPVAFSCRTLEQSKKVAKYKNSPESPIFHKSDMLFGLHAAKRSVKEKDSINLVEGNTDVLRLHWLNIDNTVAALGTALTTQQIELIKRYTDNVTLIYDGDAAGKKALIKNGTTLLKAGINVYAIILPDGQDPGDFFYLQQQFEHYDQNKTDFLLHIAKQKFSAAGADVRKKQKVIEDIVDLLYPMTELARNLYIQELMKLSSTKTKEWSSLLVKKRKSEDRLKRKNQTYSYINGMTAEMEEMLENYSFYYSQDNQMYFKAEGSAVNLKGRFTIHPLFHIESDNGHVRKLFKLKNYRGDERVLETDIASLQSPVKLSEKLEEKGNYVFEGGKIELTRLKRWLYDTTKYSRSVDVLGWQKDGFWAWADGIVDQEGTFKETDEYGIVKFKNQYYYVPAYSQLNENTNEFNEMRKFSYAIQDVSLKKWSQLMLDVYGKNAMLSIAAYAAALFSDHIFSVTRSLPLINFFGPKGSGKSEHGFAISALFGTQLKELNINNATQSRLSNFVNDFRNSAVLIDEYKNSLHPQMIESLKMLWNRQVRGRNTLNSNNRIVADNSLAVNSMIMIAGQEMMTADIALFSRAIFLPSYKTKYSQAEKQKFNELKEIQDRGLAHLTSDLMKLRLVFEKGFTPEYREVSKCLKKAVNKNIDERLIQNHAIVLTALKLVAIDHEFAFSFEEAFQESVSNIERQYKLMTSSNEISGFFKVMTFMFERGLIRDDVNFRLKSAIALGTHTWSEPKHLLLLRWDGLYQHYAEIGRKTGENVMPEESLRYYLENSDAYIDKHRLRFKQIGSRWAMVFDYKICESYGLHLTRDDSDTGSDEKDGLIEANGIRTVEVDGKTIVTQTDDVPF